MVQVQYKSQIQVLRSDNGGEYTNSDLRAFLDHHGIVHQTTCPYTPQQNGAAEHKNRQLLEVVHASLLDGRLLLSYWGETLISAAYLINRVPSRSVDFQTPLQALSSHVDAPAVPNLPPHVFGCVAFVHLHKQYRSKLEPRALRCVFVGYASNQKGYCCYHPPIKKLFVTVDVAFHENDMHFAHSESAFQGENQTEVQTLDYNIPDVNNLGLSGDVLETSGDDSQKHNDVNHLDLGGDVLETSGDDSQENNDVNDLELSGNALELRGDHSHENNVDEPTPSENSLPTSSPLDNSLSPTTS
ncbi:hypothetical protein ACFX2B_030197 [Malus domestica]